MPYTDRYVAFIDILGFGDIVKETSHDPTPRRFDALVKALDKIGSREGHLDNVGDDFQFQTFSDSIVISSNASGTGLIYFLSAINYLALDLLSNGLLARGAVAKGKLYHRDAVMFGPAFLEAYRAEQEIAKYPRVLLSRETYSDLSELKPMLNFPDAICADDGPPFLNVLFKLKDLNAGAFTIAQRNSDEVIQAQSWQRILQDLLDESIYDPRHFEKHRWFALYWNSIVGFAPNAAIKPLTFPGSRNTAWTN